MMEECQNLCTYLPDGLYSPSGNSGEQNPTPALSAHPALRPARPPWKPCIPALSAHPAPRPLWKPCIPAFSAHPALSPPARSGNPALPPSPIESCREWDLFWGWLGA